MSDEEIKKKIKHIWKFEANQEDVDYIKQTKGFWGNYFFQLQLSKKRGGFLS